MPGSRRGSGALLPLPLTLLLLPRPDCRQIKARRCALPRCRGLAVLEVHVVLIAHGEVLGSSPEGVWQLPDLHEPRHMVRGEVAGDDPFDGGPADWATPSVAHDTGHAGRAHRRMTTGPR